MLIKPFQSNIIYIFKYFYIHNVYHNKKAIIITRQYVKKSKQKDFNLYLKKNQGKQKGKWYCLIKQNISQGLDAYKKTRVQKRIGRNVTSTNLYLKLLIKLYKFLSRRTDAKFNQVVLRRLQQSRVNRYPVSVSFLTKNLNKLQKKERTLVVVANVTNDARLLELPKMTVCALKFTETARRRIVAAGGKCLTFDQLAQANPTGTGTVLLRGKKVREELKHFGLAPGSKGSHTKPYVRSKGRKFEKARGKR